MLSNGLTLICMIIWLYRRRRSPIMGHHVIFQPRVTVVAINVSKTRHANRTPPDLHINIIRRYNYKKSHHIVKSSALGSPSIEIFGRALHLVFQIVFFRLVSRITEISWSGPIWQCIECFKLFWEGSVERDKAVRSAASWGSQCVGQSGAGYLAQLSVNVLCLHKSLYKLEPKQFRQFLASVLTRMILRSFRSSLYRMGSFIFGRASCDIFIEIRGASVFIYRVIRSNIAFTSWCLLPIRADALTKLKLNCKVGWSSDSIHETVKVVLIFDEASIKTNCFW